jgi:molybdopterin-guanine dinucleotide biosynthesis protein A
MVTNNISGVILAGGANTRFDGKIKANLVINGKTIISGITELFSRIFSEIIIVTNTPEEFKEYNKYRIVGDQFIKVGPLGGIHAAMKTSTKESVFVVAVDMPLLSKEFIIKQIEYFESNRCEVLIPSVHQNIEPLHAIYSCTILKRIEEYLSGNTGFAVRDFLSRVEVRYIKYEYPDIPGSPFTNINSPSDLKIVEKILQKHKQDGSPQTEG